MSLKGYHEASLHPPAADDAAAATVWDWGEALLDRSAYMVYKKNHKINHTTACCSFKRNLDDDGVMEVEMQVSLFLAPPPRVSYFCCSASCTDDDGHGEQEDTPRLFVSEPWMMATDGDLALFTLCHGHNPAFCRQSSNHDYFVYEAAASPAAAGTPRLTRLPQVERDMLPAIGTHSFHTGSIGILRYHSPNDDACDADAYRIPAVAYDYFHPGHSGYYLCTYDSMDCVWIRKPATCPQPPPPDDFVADKAITIGGSGSGSCGGIMGWVDLWSGMLLCDVLAAPDDTTLCTPLHYLPLPEPRQPENRLPLATDIAYFFRDIALANDSGIIRFVDLQVHAEPSPRSQTPSGWTVVTWTTWTLEGLDRGLDTLFFQQEHEIHSLDILGYSLPQSLFVSNPILSSHSDGVLYLLTNASSEDTRTSQVIAVDLKQKKLLDVEDFDMQRPDPYIGTTISSYLMPAAAVSKEKENMKRRAPGSLESSRKKPLATSNPAGGEGDVGDAMDLPH